MLRLWFFGDEATYDIQSSTNLTDWSVIATVSPITGRVDHAITPLLDRGFYRYRYQRVNTPAVYSVDYVGYVNKTLLPGYNLIGNPLNNGNNSVNTLFTTNFTPNFGDTIYGPGSGGFASATYFGSWFGDSMLLAPGNGFFYFNAGASPLNVTFVGNGMEGPNLMTIIPRGLSLRASKIPQAGSLAPRGQLEFPTPAFGDTVHQWRTQGYTSATWFGAWLPFDPVIEVGEAFWYYSMGPLTWVRSFEVIP